MTPEKFKILLYTIIQYPKILFMFFEDCIKYVWNWFNGKKTIIGGIFFVANTYLAEPIMEHYNYNGDLEFWLTTIASLLIILGVTHKGLKKHNENI